MRTDVAILSLLLLGLAALAHCRRHEVSEPSGSREYASSSDFRRRDPSDSQPGPAKPFQRKYASTTNFRAPESDERPQPSVETKYTSTSNFRNQNEETSHNDREEDEEDTESDDDADTDNHQREYASSAIFRNKDPIVQTSHREPSPTSTSAPSTTTTTLAPRIQEPENTGNRKYASSAIFRNNAGEQETVRRKYASSSNIRENSTQGTSGSVSVPTSPSRKRDPNRKYSSSFSQAEVSSTSVSPSLRKQENFQSLRRKPTKVVQSSVSTSSNSYRELEGQQQEVKYVAPAQTVTSTRKQEAAEINRRKYGTSSNLHVQEGKTSEKCLHPNGYFPDSEQCDKYYDCRDGKAIEKLCPDGLVFNDFSPQHEKCDLPFGIDCTRRPKLQTPQSSPHCIRLHGYFAHENPAICNTFYYCVEGKFNMINCPDGLVFSEKTGICTWPDEAKKKGCGSKEIFNFTCPKVDDSVAVTHPRYADPEDCQFFYVCINGDTPRRSGCKLGQAFDEKSGKCDWARKIPECKDWYNGVLTDAQLDLLENPTPRPKPAGGSSVPSKRKNNRPSAHA